LLEKAQAAGYRTGNVTTAELTDATPAVLDSHVSARSCQGPADMSACPAETKQAGGLGSIAEQTIDHRVDVLLGGGKARFDQLVTGGRYAGASVTAQAVSQGYNVVTDRAGLKAASPGRKVLGLFAPGNMDLEWTGPLAAPYPGPAATSCTMSNPARPGAEPHLSEMTAKAIELLSTKSRGDRRNGFYLQVEGASIDKQDHAANPCGQIGETVEFDRSIRVALQWAQCHPDTVSAPKIASPLATARTARTTSGTPVPARAGCSRFRSCLPTHPARSDAEMAARCAYPVRWAFPAEIVSPVRCRRRRRGRRPWRPRCAARSR
jgi:alkaline phosphatase